MTRKNLLLIPVLLTLALSCVKYPLPDRPQKENPGQGDTPTAITTETIDLDIENAEVKKYMDFVYGHPYTTSDFTATYIDKYYETPRKEGYRGDCPAGAEIKWESVSGAASYITTLSEHEDMSAPVQTATLSYKTQEYTVTNLIPGRRYYCTVSAKFDDGTTTDIHKATINTTGRRRMIAIDAIGNVRDLGGLATEDGKHTKYGLLFRGSRLNNNGMELKAADKDELLRIGIMADLDLREDTADKLGTVYGRYKSPISDNIDYKLFPLANKSYFKKLRDNDEYIKAVQWMIGELKAGKPVYFHCKTGADRTGTLAFLIESLLGVTETDKSIDYELTSFFYDFGDPKTYAFRSRDLAKTIEIAAKENYDWGGMYNVIDKYYTGSTIQQKAYNYLNKGIGTSSSAKVSSTDLDWFISYMLE